MPTTAAARRPDPSRIAAVRRFTRFYTRQIGLLNEHLYSSPFSLTEVRVLYELAHRASTTASELGRDLGLDAGYLSRILRRFHAQALIERTTSNEDARQALLKITAKGRKAFAPLNERSEEQIETLLKRISPADQDTLATAMGLIENILGERADSEEPFTVRTHHSGDMGWVVYRHGLLYRREYGYDERFEALVARIVSDFIQNLDPQRERCWIAERNGAIVGSVFLVKKSSSVAKLRLLLVEPSARGMGIGRRLVEECVAFAGEAGYRKITLWTQQELTSARKIYQATGFKMVHSEANPMLNSVAETWEMKL